MLAFFSAIPIIGKIVTGITTAWFNAKVKLVTARVGGDVNVATALVKGAAAADHESTARLGIIASNKILTMMMVGFATPLIIFVWKIVVVDKVIGPGCIGWHPFGWEVIADHCWIGKTDPITGDVASWASAIIASLFGSGTVLAIGKMYFGRDKTGE